MIPDDRRASRRPGGSTALRLAGATALITGATGGIGMAIARRLHAEGVRLILSGRRPDAVQALADELGAATEVADLSSAADVARLGESAARAEIDLLVANAALPASGDLMDLTAEQIDRMLDVNLRAPIALARAVTPGLIDRGRGHLVFISSLSGKAAAPTSSMYAATKFGLRGFALSLREDLAPHGIGASLVSPGFIRDAGMFARADVQLPAGVGTRSPLEVADAVVRAVQRNRAEIAVAPLGLRAGATLATAVPGLAAWGARRMGSHRIAAEMAERQRGER
jgi:short-subunit dehydrogenase